MTYICYSCGEVFEDYDAGTVTEHHPEVHADEHFMACPNCRSTEVGEAWQCEECDGYFNGDETNFDGICFDCLKKVATPDNFLRYAIDCKSRDNHASVLEEFVFEKLWQIDSPKQTCDELMYLLIDAYHAHKYDEFFQDRIYEYFDYSNDFHYSGDWYDFSEWWSKKRRSK